MTSPKAYAGRLASDKVFDLVTVVYAKELPYLEIQAKSIEQYVPLEQISSIIVIINDDIPNHSIDPSWYGTARHKLIIKNYKELNVNIQLDGWNSQQLCKLLATNHATSTWSMILDAKTWFVRSFNAGMVLDQGKIKRHFTEPSDFFSGEQTFIEQLYGISFKSTVRCGVPFYIHNKTCKDLLKSIENFVDFFQKNVKNPHNVTEFLLYIGFLIHNDITDTLYSDGYEFSDINVADWQYNEFDQLLTEARNDIRVITFSLNSVAYVELSDEQINDWLEFLKDKHLINDLVSTRNKLNTLYN